jgi:RHH-type transcriptional regulator, rel operon repressor / antitoxin RelB
MLGIRLEPELERRLEALARQTGKSKSYHAREPIQHYLTENNLAAEARRQSVSVSRRENEQDALDFIENATDQTGWR